MTAGRARAVVVGSGQNTAIGRIRHANLQILFPPLQSFRAELPRLARLIIADGTFVNGHMVAAGMQWRSLLMR